LNAAVSVAATTMAGAPPIVNLNHAHGTVWIIITTIIDIE
jgi:hypothetical protein